MAAKTPNLITHFVEEDGGSVLPLCGDWNYATSWTTSPDAASCPHCVARLAEQQAGRGREREADSKPSSLRLVPPE